MAELSLIVYCALQNMKTRERAYTMADKGNKESATPNRQSETRMSTHAVRRFWTGKVRACLKQMLFTTRIISNCVKCEVREVLIKLWAPDINTVDGIYESNIKTRVTLGLRVCLEM